MFVSISLIKIPKHKDCVLFISVFPGTVYKNCLIIFDLLIFFRRHKEKLASPKDTKSFIFDLKL